MANFLKFMYNNFWTPVFGRILILFSSWIEGENINEKEEMNEEENKK